MADLEAGCPLPPRALLLYLLGPLDLQIARHLLDFTSLSQGSRTLEATMSLFRTLEGWVAFLCRVPPQDVAHPGAWGSSALTQPGARVGAQRRPT